MIAHITKPMAEVPPRSRTLQTDEADAPSLLHRLLSRSSCPDAESRGTMPNVRPRCNTGTSSQRKLSAHGAGNRISSRSEWWPGQGEVRIRSDPSRYDPEGVPDRRVPR